MSEQKGTDKPKFTPEQMAEMKKRMLDNYKEQIDFLKVQVEFEELSMRVTEAQARSARAETVLAQIYAPREPEKESPEKETSTGQKTEPNMVQREEGVPKENLTRKLKND